MKKILKYIVIPLVSILLFLNVTILLCLNVTSIQEWIVGGITNTLSEKTNTKIAIGQFQLDLFDGVFVSDLLVEDLNKDTLAFVKRMNVGYSMKTIYRKETLTLKRVALEDFKIKLTAPNDSADYNFQFLVDAFSSEETDKDTSSSEFKLAIEEINLQNGSFEHTIENTEVTPGLFNASRLKVDSFNLLTNLNIELPNHIDANIQQLSAKEKSGLIIRNLQSHLEISLDSLSFVSPQIAIFTESSEINANNVYFNTESMHLDATIENTAIVAADFQCFAPLLKNLTRPTNLSAHAKGQLPQIEVSLLSLHHPDLINLKASLLSIEDYTKWDKSPFAAQIEEMTLPTKALNTIKNLLGSELPPIVDSLLPCSLQLKATGSLPDIREELTLKSAIGEIHSNGSIGYSHESGHLASQIDLDSYIPSLRPLMGSDMIEELKAVFNLQLDWDLKQLPTAKINGQIKDITFNGYAYDTISVNGEFQHSNDLNLNLSSEDPNCNLDLDADIKKLLTDSMVAKLSANIRNFAPKNLHLADSIPNYQVGLNLQMDGVGMDYNQWNGNFKIDNLKLKNDSNILFIPKSIIKQTASDRGNKKSLEINMPFLTADIKGNFKYEKIYDCMIYNLGKYLPTLFPANEVEEIPSQMNFNIKLQEPNDILQFFGINTKIAGEIVLTGDLSTSENGFNLLANTPLIEIGEKEQTSSIAPTLMKFEAKKNGLKGEFTSRIKPNKEEDFSAVINTKLFIRKDSIYNIIELGTTPNIEFLQGGLINCISFHPTKTEDFRTHVSIQKSSIFLNGQQININPSEMDILTEKKQLDKITIENFGISARKMPLLSVNGILSHSLKDTLNIKFDKLNLNTLSALAYKTDLPVDCQINGEIKSCAIFGDNFRFFTKDFHIDSLVYNNTLLGDLSANAFWDNNRKAVYAKMKFAKEGKNLMDIKGVVSPAKQTIKMNAALDSVPLEMAIPFIQDYVSDLKGYLASDISIKGDFSDLDINGYIYLNEAQAKINYTGVTYFISDSIKMEGNHLYAKNFRVKDNFDNYLLFNGDIFHEKLKKFNYKMSLSLKNFALLNNPKERDKIAYGKFFANGRNLKLVGDEKHAELTGDFSNAENTSVHINLPETFTEANTYDNIVYVTPNKHVEIETNDSLQENNNEEKFDIYANLKLGLTDQASFHINIADGAMIRGNGNLQIIYDNDKLALYNRFTVNDGFLKLKISGLPTKKFSLKEGSYVDFIGDPMNLRFNATASYLLTADLTTLSNSFSSITSGSTRVPVSCDLTATGNLQNMQLAYDVSLPKATEDLQQSVASIINTDNIRIKQFAYLIGVGMFNDPSGQVQSDAAMSFASSSLSSTLNNVLGNVLGDKVTIGTDINSSKEDLSDMEVGVSVSTKLANDKLLLSTNLGVQTQGNSANQDATFLSDFDAEYLIGKTGMFRIKAYNHTNNDFYRTSNNTQGLGFSFVRESKELKGLFKIREEFKKKREAIEKGEYPSNTSDTLRTSPIERKEESANKNKGKK
jgi:hypothetical protein